MDDRFDDPAKAPPASPHAPSVGRITELGVSAAKGADPIDRFYADMDRQLGARVRALVHARPLAQWEVEAGNCHQNTPAAKELITLFLKAYRG